MGKIRTRGAVKKKNVACKLKFVVEKLHRSLLLGNKSLNSMDVPEDVKEGHFAVIAVHGEEPQRLVLPLSCLNHPNFVRLLEEAAEEYGFNHEGALAIPCSPTELQRILDELHNRQRWNDSSDDSVGSCEF